MGIINFRKRDQDNKSRLAEDDIREKIIDSLPLNGELALDDIDCDMVTISNVLINLEGKDKLVVTFRHDGSGYLISGRFDYKSPFYGHSKLATKFIYKNLDSALSIFVNQTLVLKKYNISIIPSFPKGENNTSVSRDDYIGDMYLILRKVDK